MNHLHLLLSCRKLLGLNEKIVRGTLETIADIVKENNISRTAMIVVSKCLDTEYAKSRLYAPEFSHMYRQGTDKA